ncbi:MAG TPA: response regulator [Cyanophyceae cyanobacterium]
MKPLILIIEDDSTFRSILFELLELEDYNVVSAEDGSLGLQLAQALQPNLIISDIGMPKLDGYGVLKQLREDLTTAKIPFIFLTAQTDSISHQRAMQLGANDYLIKPVSYGQLVVALQNQLQPKSDNLLPKLPNLPKVKNPAS